MTDRFVVGDRPAATVQGTRLVSDGAELLAGGTGLWVGKGLGLLFQQGGERAFQQSLGSRLRGLLEGEEVEIQGGASRAKGAAGDDFTPLGGEVVEIVEVLG